MDTAGAAADTAAGVVGTTGTVDSRLRTLQATDTRADTAASRLSHVSARFGCLLVCLQLASCIWRQGAWWYGTGAGARAGTRTSWSGGVAVGYGGMTWLLHDDCGSQRATGSSLLPLSCAKYSLCAYGPSCSSSARPPALARPHSLLSTPPLRSSPLVRSAALPASSTPPSPVSDSNSSYSSSRDSHSHPSFLSPCSPVGALLRVD